MEWSGVEWSVEYFYSSLDWMLVHRKVTPSSKFAGTYPFIHLDEEWHYESKVSCPRTQRSGPVRGIEPGPLDPESSAL